MRGAAFNGAKPSRGRLTPADGRGDEDRMEVGSENTWKKEWNFCR